jgi:hypothetical protein
VKNRKRGGQDRAGIEDGGESSAQWTRVFAGLIDAVFYRRERELPPDVQRALSDFVAAARTYVEVCTAHGISGESRTGRKTLCTPNLINQICELLSDSVSIRTTCEVVGISESRFHAWCVRGALDRGLFAEFLKGTRRARKPA